ncbi:MAG TPA: DUF1641 domain-containing protein [Anaerolineae bacterium]|nr:DUF1641 domain-containing protein [Anaerolineae bacterium]HMR64608.1 DUF1641 domain-containing protein [Anaerolineae bacterium]
MPNGNGVVTATPQERLRQRLNEPETAEALLNILDRIDLVAFAVDSVDGFLRRGDVIIDNISDSVQEVRGLASVPNLDVEKTVSALSESLPSLIEALPQLSHALPQLLHLVERLEEPTTAQALDQILDRIELVAFSLTSIDGFLQRSDTIIDNVVEGVHEIRALAPSDELNLLGTLAETLPRLTAVLPQLLEVLPQFMALLPLLAKVTTQLQTILESKEFDALMSSGVFSPQAVGIVGEAGNALVDSYQANQVKPESLGLFGLFRAISDPDVQRSLGFLVEFGKTFGQKIDKTQ